MAYKYVWIVTRATSHADGTETAEVLHQCKTPAKAKEFCDHGGNGPNLGYEGPNRADLYPAGKVFRISDGQPA